MNKPVVREKDNGYEALKQRWMNHQNRRVLAVGIFGAGATEDNDGTTNLLIAIVHEFGAPSVNIPSRSWLRAWVDENEAELRRRIRELGERVYKNQIGYDQALEQLGAWAVGRIQSRIADKIPPPLAPATVESRLAKPSRQAQVAHKKLMRGADSAAVFTPLIDEGQFRQAITYEVRNK